MQLIWILLGLFAILLRVIGGAFPEVTEHIYSRGLFVALRWVWDYSLGFSPVPLLYVGLCLLLGLVLWRIKRRRASGKKQTLRHRIGGLALSLGAWAGGLVFVFVLTWGLNYGRVSLERQLQLPAVEVGAAPLRKEMETATEDLKSARHQIPDADTTAIFVADLFPKLEASMRIHLEEELTNLGFPAPGRPRVRRIQPPGFLIGWGASGVYLPFIGEGQIDAGVPDLLQAPVLAHELAHAYGFGDEGSCNFLAYLACERAEDPRIRYCGRLFYWRELAGAYYRFSKEEFLALRDSLPAGIRADLAEIRYQQNRYNPWLPGLSRWIYDRYLKSQGMPEGLQNYDRVVELVMSWRMAEAARLQP